MMTRVDRLLRKMEEHSLDAMLVTDKINRTWLTRFNGSLGWAVVTPEHRLLYVDARYTEQAASQAVGWDVREVDFEALRSAAAASLIADGVLNTETGAVGFESDRVTYDQYVQLIWALRSERLVAATQFVDGLRAIKDQDELAEIERASKIADAAIAHLRQEIRPGMMEMDLAWLVESFCRQQGASSLNFVLIGTGERSSLVHARPQQRRIAEGDLVLVDIGPVVNGYGTDLTRTFVVGEADEWQGRMYGAVLEAQQVALEACRPGMTGAQLDRVARDSLSRAGLGDRFSHLLGHGLGLQSSEPPLASPESGDVLVPGHVLTIEPGVYFPGRGGIRIEDTVVVTETGARRLTWAPKSL